MSALEFIKYCSDAFYDMALDQKIPFILALVVSIWLFSKIHDFIIWLIMKIFKKNDKKEI